MCNDTICRGEKLEIRKKCSPIRIWLDKTWYIDSRDHGRFKIAEIRSVLKLDLYLIGTDSNIYITTG